MRRLLSWVIPGAAVIAALASAGFMGCSSAGDVGQSNGPGGNGLGQNQGGSAGQSAIVINPTAGAGGASASGNAGSSGAAGSTGTC
jgi:hypothetical protein